MSSSNPFEAIAQMFAPTPSGPPGDPLQYDQGIVGRMSSAIYGPSAAHVQMNETRRAEELKLQEREGVRSAALTREEEKLREAQQVAQEFQRLMQVNGGDTNAATRELLQSPVFSRSFARGDFQTLLNTIKTLGQGPVDPGQAIVAGLQPTMDRLDARDPLTERPGPLAQAAGLDPAQAEALRQMATLSPTAAATATATRLGERAFPAPPAATGPNPEEDKQRIRRGVQMLDKVTEEGAAAARVQADLTALEGVLERTPGGAMTGLRSIAAGYGIPVQGASDLQLATAIVGRLGPAQRTPGTGAMSDFETRSLMATIPSAWQTPEGRQMVLRQMRAMADHAQARGRIANDFYAGGTTIQETFAELAAQERRFVENMKRLRERAGNTAPLEIAPGVTIRPR